MNWLTGATCGVALLSVLQGSAVRAAVPTVRVVLSPDVREKPFTGRVYLFASRSEQEPRFGPQWFHPEPFLAQDVVDWQPGTSLEFSSRTPNLLTFPRDFSSVDLTGARIQAVARLNPLERRVGRGAGNAYSGIATVTADRRLELRIDQLVPVRPFRETPRLKLLTIRSEILSSFHRRDVHLRASVALPDSYDEHPQRQYPTVFEIPGFGGTHRNNRRQHPGGPDEDVGVEFLRVVLDPSCPLGHHAFADSANNGPVGTALVEELVPEFDRRFRSISDPQARFLTGHSSGGWSSLWLQIVHPDTFGGVWSTAPDPVDFRDFQRIDLYAPGVNMYVDEAGNRRPLAVVDGRPHLWYDSFAWMEHVLGHGGQLHSFEAVFSPRREDGTPALLWDRESGQVDSTVADSWKAYDIRLVLEENWETLAQKLRGDLHIFMGSQDTFLLEGATILLKESLRQLGSDAVVEIVPGKDHSTLLDAQLKARIRHEMIDRFLASFPDWPEVRPQPQ